MSRLFKTSVLGALAGLALGVFTWMLLGRSASMRASPDASRRSSVPHNTLRREPLDAAERAIGGEALRRICESWRRQYQYAESESSGGWTCGTISPGLFRSEWSNGFTELRLFSLGYPDVALEWARGVTESADGSAWERGLAAHVLGYLTTAGWEPAEPPLVRLCRHPDGRVRSFAQGRLIAGPLMEKHRELFRDMADGPPLLALTYLRDPGAKRKLEDAVARWKELPEHAQSIPFQAHDAVKWWNAVESGTWEDYCKAVISERKEHGIGRLYWVLRMARERRVSWLSDMLRTELTFSQEHQGVRLVSPGHSESDRFDLFLQTLMELGGPLDEHEKTYLKRFGYGCEPRARLAEILEEKKYPR